MLRIHTRQIYNSLYKLEETMQVSDVISQIIVVL